MTLGRTRRRLLAAGAVLVTVGVTGCTDGGNATPTPTASAVTTNAEPTPSATPTPTPVTAPERPAAMATPSADGAAAAAGYFISLYPYVFATGDLAEWDLLSADDCKYCTATRASVEDQLARNVRGEGSEITLLSSTGTELAPGDSYAADLEITQGPSFEVSASGVRRPDGDGGSFRLHLALWWRDGWIVRAVDASRV